MTGTPKRHLYLAVRWTGMLAALAVCVAVLSHGWRSLPVGDVLFLGLFGALAQSRPIRLPCPMGGKSGLKYFPGEGVFVAALLRDGPAAVLAVTLLASLALIHTKEARTQLVKSPLAALDNLFFNPALFWLLSLVYHGLGGHPLLTASDSGLFFQNPLRIVLPLLFSSFLCHGLIDRLYNVLLMSAWQRAWILPSLADLKDSTLMYAEIVCGALGLALWTAWGWCTLPFSLLIAGTAILATRNYLERGAARRDADSDPLTGLASWRGLENFLRRRITLSRRSRTPFAVLFLDADGLKRVNDQWGHGAGDELLALIGDCCRRHARKEDLAGRRGGDEFLLVLTGLGRIEGEKVRDRLQKAIEDRLAEHGRFAGLAGVSAGLAVFPDDAQTEDALVATADARMYADKQHRKRAVAV